ncbi:MAG: cell division protein ZapA [Gallionellaceae bacterium]|nr:MAG: cell division protein ZapA [Gallionellaceae bacterium]
MSGNKSHALDVKILDREFRVSCPEDEKAELLDAAAYLDKKMSEIRDKGKIASVEKIAIMAALNITHEFLTTRLGGGVDMGDYKRRMQTMQAAIDEALADQDKLF